MHVEVTVEVRPLVPEEAAHQVHAVLVPAAGLRRPPVTVRHQLACRSTLGSNAGHVCLFTVNVFGTLKISKITRMHKLDYWFVI